MKKSLFHRIMIAAVFTCLFCGFAATDAVKDTSEKIYVVPVKGEIEKGLAYFVQRCVDEAADSDAKAVILHMDTNGGELGATENIMRTLLRCPFETYTFVDNKAFSAGALISVATKHIYMAPASVIGAATPIAMAPGGGVQNLGEAVEEKITSGVRALIATAAEENGHPRKVVEAMVDRDVEIRGIIEKGKLLTLTNKEAAKKQVNLSEGTVSGIDELIKKIGGGTVVTMKVSLAEKVARMVTNSAVRSLLMMLGMLAIYVEIKAPGFGVGGISALVCFGLFFFGHYIAGLAGWEEFVLFAAGVAFVMVEIFLIPGFGIMGLSGMLLILGSFILAMTGVEKFPEIAWWNQEQYQQAFHSLGIAIAGSVGLAVAAFKFILPKSSYWGKISLEDTEMREAGFSISSYGEYLGREGISQTMLRPSGKAKFGEKILDVVTEGDLIPRGTQVKIIRVEGYRIVVTKKDND